MIEGICVARCPTIPDPAEMKSLRSLPGGELEYAVLDAIWASGAASAPQIYAQVGEPNGRAYTTVAKVLDRLLAKGLLSRVRTGRAFTYTAQVPRAVVQRALAERVVRLLLEAGDRRRAIETLVETIECTDAALGKELARLVAARRRVKAGKSPRDP